MFFLLKKTNNAVLPLLVLNQQLNLIPRLLLVCLRAHTSNEPPHERHTLIKRPHTKQSPLQLPKREEEKLEQTKEVRFLNAERAQQIYHTVSRFGVLAE